MAKRASPRPGRDGNGPTPDETMDALATEILDNENAKMIREQRKRHRAAYEAKGGNLGNLDALFKRRDDTADDIIAFFTSMFQTFGAYFEEFTQLEFFTKKTTTSERRGFEHVGRMAGLKGEAPGVPPNLVGDEIQDYERGYRSGIDARNRNKKSLADTFAAVLATPEGTVIDGTTGAPIKPLTAKEKKAADAAAKIAAAAKQPDPESQAKAPEAGGEASSIKLADQPDWSGYDDDPIKWAPEQSRAFQTWFNSLAPGVSVQMVHPGIRKAFSAMRGDGVTAADVIGVVEEIIQEGLDAKIGGDTFEATPEEIAAQAGRKGGATDIDDPLVVDGIRHANKTRANEARRLKASQSEQAAAKRAEAGVP